MQHSQDRSGEHIGDYRLLRRLGAGSFGEVYLAEDLREQRQVALKLLKTPLTDRENLKAFLNEARSFRLTHPGMVPLLDMGMSEQDLPFLVMEYLAGGTLRQRYPKGTRVPLDVVVRMTAQVASALQYAHDRHLIHRDVKPENMLSRADGSVLLSDFGLVTVAHASSSVNLYQLYGGTLPYMAPEQYAGKPRAASDQYALAVVVYEWLAGARPFQGTGPEIVFQHLQAPPPLLLEQVPTLPARVEQVVLRALAKQPEDRFARVQDFADALQEAFQLATSSPTTSSPPPVLSSSFEVSAPLLVSPSSPTATLPAGWSPSVPSRSAQIAPGPEASFPVPTLPAASPAPLPGEREATRPATGSEVVPTEVANSLTLPVPASPPARLWRRFTGRAILLFLLAVLLIGSGSLGYLVYQNAALANQATATANAAASATSSSQATRVAGELATGQANLTAATAQAQATAGVLQTATAGQPTYTDPLTAGNVSDTTWTNDGTSCVFAADGYHVQVDTSTPQPTKDYDHFCTESDRSYQNMAITIDMRIRGGNSGGLLFRLQNNQGYFFEVGIGGNYQIARWGVNFIQEWTVSPAIKQGLESLNTLQVIAQGNDLRFYVNGVYLTQVQDTAYRVGAIGFVGYTNLTIGPSDAVFSNLHIYLLN